MCIIITESTKLLLFLRECTLIINLVYSCHNFTQKSEDLSFLIYVIASKRVYTLSVYGNFSR